MSEEAGTVETGGESSGVDAGVAELTQDFFSGSEPSDAGGIAAVEQADDAGEGESSEPSATAQPQTQPVAAQQPKAQRAEAATTETPTAQTFTYQGRKYTAEDLAKNPGLLAAIVTSAEQLPHLTKKHQEILEKVATQGRPAPAQQQSQPGYVAPQEIIQQYGPEAQALAQAGYLEAEFVDAFPGVSANMVGYRNVIENMSQKLAQLEGFAQHVSQERAETQNYQQVSQVATSFRSNISAIADLAPAFAPLKDPQVAQEFEKFVIETLNPVAASVVGEAGRDWLARAAYAYFGPTLAQASQQQAAAASQARATARRHAVGDAGGARSGATATDEWGNVLASFGV